MVADVTPLYEACKAKKVVALTSYTKKDGSNVAHTVGIYEIRTEEGKMWGWDVQLNDHIRAFILNDINAFEVLDQDFMPSQGWDIKIDGEIIV